MAAPDASKAFETKTSTEAAKTAPPQQGNTTPAQECASQLTDGAFGGVVDIACNLH